MCDASDGKPQARCPLLSAPPHTAAPSPPRSHPLPTQTSSPPRPPPHTVAPRPLPTQDPSQTPSSHCSPYTGLPTQTPSPPRPPSPQPPPHTATLMPPPPSQALFWSCLRAHPPVCGPDPLPRALLRGPDEPGAIWEAQDWEGTWDPATTSRRDRALGGLRVLSSPWGRCHVVAGVPETPLPHGRAAVNASPGSWSRAPQGDRGKKLHPVTGARLTGASALLTPAPRSTPEELLPEGPSRTPPTPAEPDRPREGEDG